MDDLGVILPTCLGTKCSSCKDLAKVLGEVVFIASCVAKNKRFVTWGDEVKQSEGALQCEIEEATISVKETQSDVAL